MSESHRASWTFLKDIFLASRDFLLLAGLGLSDRLLRLRAGETCQASMGVNGDRNRWPDSTAVGVQQGPQRLITFNRDPQEGP